MDWREINDSWVKPACAAWEAGDTEEAERLFRRGLTATSNDGWVAVMYAEMLEKLGRLREAKANYELALSRLPLPRYKSRARLGLSRVAAALAEEKRAKEPSPAIDESQPQHWGLISCTKRKKEHACLARELYAESPGFVRHLGFAEEHYHRVFVVSAGYGLVSLDQLVVPYDRSLWDLTDREREEWARFIVNALCVHGLQSQDEVFIHADSLYAKHLAAALEGYAATTHVIDFESTPRIESDQKGSP